VTNYEIDYDRAVDALLSVLRTGVFYQTDDDIINRLGGPKVQTPARLARIAANAGTASEFGIEIGIKGHTESGFRWNASYSLASVTQNLNLNLTGVPTSPLLLEAGTPEHNIIVGAGYSWRKFEFDGQLRWQSSYDDFNGSLANPIVKVSNFITSSARVGYKVTDNLTVALSGDQLAQNRLIVTGGPPIERRIIASATVRF
jgi:iron complex outermembrane receptor protein